MSPINSNTLPKEVTVIPSYNRNYTSKKEVLKAWREGKDFRIVGIKQGGGTYINKEDADRFGVSVRIRYNKRKRVTTIKPEDNEVE